MNAPRRREAGVGSDVEVEMTVEMATKMRETIAGQQRVHRPEEHQEKEGGAGRV